MSSQARKLKVKWTEQMNKDILECKKKAQELISSENPPCNVNGRKRGYIDVMKELWDDTGYKNLQLKSQNLRDQASRLEKIRGKVSAQPHTIVKQICFPNGNVLFLSLFPLFKN